MEGEKGTMHEGQLRAANRQRLEKVPSCIGDEYLSLVVSKFQ